MSCGSNAWAIVLLACVLAAGCKRSTTASVRADTPSSDGSHTAVASSPDRVHLGPDRPAICRAVDMDAGMDKWARFGDTIPIFRGGLLCIGTGRASDAEAVIAEFGLRESAVIECPPGRVLVWVPGGRGKPEANEEIRSGLMRAGLRVQETVEFNTSEGHRWLNRVCDDAAACCRQLRLACSFSATSETDMRSCIQWAKQQKHPHIDPSCQ